MMEFHFLRPVWLLALPVLALMLWWIARLGPRARIWERLCDDALLQPLLRGALHYRRRTLVLAGLGWLAATLALAGPTWEKVPLTLYNAPPARVLVLDLSRSMDATDIKPSRLQWAKFKTIDLLNRLTDETIALVVFANEAYPIAPLTHDAKTVAALVPVLETQIMPAQGSSPRLGLERARQLLRRSGVTRGEIWMITDGDDLSETVALSGELAAEGFALSVLLVSTDAGAPIPDDNGFVRDTDGAIVVSRPNIEGIRAAVAAGGGRLVITTADTSDIDQLIAAGDNNVTAEVNEQALASEGWQDRGPWITLALLPLAALAFRRGWLLGIAIVLIQPTPQALALDWETFWMRADQRGARALAQGDPKSAANFFTDPDWRASAHYRNGEFEAALEQFSPDNLRGNYNRGNALARLGRYTDAIAAYDDVLKVDPDHQDAQFNRDLVESILQQQQQQPARDRENGGDPQNDRPPSEPNQGDSDENQSSSTDPGSDQPPSNPSAQNEAEPDPSDGNDTQRGGEQQIESQSDDTERAQSTKQWLRQVPDDPGGLIRRKLLYEKYRRERNREFLAKPTNKPW